jgi:DNA-binding transcriptional regulator YiaG
VLARDPYSVPTRARAPTPFSRDLAQARRALHLTQAELALYLGVTVQSISNWETARASPHSANEVRVRAMLARALRRRWRPDLGERI